MHDSPTYDPPYSTKNTVRTSLPPAFLSTTATWLPENLTSSSFDGLCRDFFLFLLRRIDACREFKGAVVLVSHDQYFLSKVATEYWGVVDGKMIIKQGLKEAKKATYKV